MKVLFLSDFHVQCNATCGEGMRHRTVLCVDGLKDPVSDRLCDPSSKPELHQLCIIAPCQYVWVTATWTQVIKLYFCAVLFRFTTNQNRSIQDIRYCIDDVLYTQTCAYGTYLCVSVLCELRSRSPAEDGVMHCSTFCSGPPGVWCSVLYPGFGF